MEDEFDPSKERCMNVLLFKVSIIIIISGVTSLLWCFLIALKQFLCLYRIICVEVVELICLSTHLADLYLFTKTHSNQNSVLSMFLWYLILDGGHM